MRFLLCYLFLGNDLRDLSHEEWHAREGAQERLQRVLPFAGPWVEYEVERASWGLLCDPEGMRRARELIIDYRGLPQCRCMLSLLGIGHRTLDYYSDFGEWIELWGKQPRSPFARKQIYRFERWEGDTLGTLGLRFDKDLLYRRYLYPLKIERTDDQWWWDDTRVATRRFANDLISVGVPKPIVRYFLCE